MKQFLGGAPCPAVTVFPQRFDQEPDVRPVAEARLGMPERKAFRVALDEGDSPFSECPHRSGVAWFRVRSVHTVKLPGRIVSSKTGLGQANRQCGALKPVNVAAGEFTMATFRGAG